MMWSRREIENYFTTRDVHLRYARSEEDQDLFALAKADAREDAMKRSIDQVLPVKMNPDLSMGDEVLKVYEIGQ